MSVDFDQFLEWAKDAFGEENIKIRSTPHGDEICTHSFVAEAKGIPDNKYHLWMNPSGGKKGSKEHGAWRCWYTEEFGTLVGLVSRWESIPWDQAEEKICDTPSLRMLEQKVHEFFGHKEEVEEPVKLVEKKLEFPPFCFKINELSPSNHWAVAAKQYLYSRNLPIDNLYVCTDGKYKNRILIPYFDRDGLLQFYNCRTMDKRDNVLRYMKCEESNQDDVLFFREWPRRGKKIYITEGELDAITLNLCGLYGCACGGKYLSDTQVEIIRQNGYEPVLAFDSDSSGEQAIMNIGETLLEKGFVEIGYIRPPKVYKDWNKMLVRRGRDIIKAYIDRFEKPYTVDTLTRMQMNRLMH
jgi:hypothetical protein